MTHDHQSEDSEEGQEIVDYGKIEDFCEHKA
jgi:hypothetical protein